MKKILVGVGVIVVLLGAFYAFNKNEGKLSESEARVIAEAMCIKGGEALESGTYNATTKTWWYNANLNATRPGCFPACVVNEETRQAEINWRCTGLLQ